MVGQVTFAAPLFTPSPDDGGGAVEAVRGGSGGAGSGTDDPAHGRRVPDAAEREHDPGARPRGPFDTTGKSMADRLITTGSDAEAFAGPKAESPMVTESHRRARRQAMIAEALSGALGGRPVDTYAVDRPPGGAPEVVHLGPPVRIGTILDIVA
jgi:hypothetical protein